MPDAIHCLMSCLFCKIWIEKEERNSRRDVLQGPAFKTRQFILERETSKFDLVLNGSESPGGTNFSLSYCTRLFRKETIERFVTYLQTMLTAVLNDPQVKICRIDFLSDEEKKKILVDFNDTGSGISSR